MVDSQLFELIFNHLGMTTKTPVQRKSLSLGKEDPSAKQRHSQNSIIIDKNDS